MRVSYCIEHAVKRMRSNFAKITMYRFKDRSSGIHGTSSITAKCAFVRAEVVKVERDAQSRSVAVHEKLKEVSEPDEIVESEDENWSFDGIMTAKDIKKQ